MNIVVGLGLGLTVLNALCWAYGANRKIAYFNAFACGTSLMTALYHIK